MTDPKTPDRRRTVQNEQPEHKRRSAMQSKEKLVFEIPDALERIVSDPEKIGENARKLSQKMEEPSGKRHCGDPDRCEKDVYAEDPCDCCCGTRCGPWNDFLCGSVYGLTTEDEEDAAFHRVGTAFAEAISVSQVSSREELQRAFDEGRNAGLEEAAMECIYAMYARLAQHIREMKKEIK